MATDETATFLVASEILNRFGGRSEAAWDVAEQLISEQSMRELFLGGISRAEEQVNRANDAALAQSA